MNTKSAIANTLSNSLILDNIFEVLFLMLIPPPGSEWDFMFERKREPEFLRLSMVSKIFHISATRALYRCIDFTHLDQRWKNQFASPKSVERKLFQLQTQLTRSRLLGYYVHSFRMPKNGSNRFLLHLAIKMPNLREVYLTDSNVLQLVEVLDGCPELELLKYRNMKSDIGTIPQKPFSQTYKLKSLNIQGFEASSIVDFNPAMISLLEKIPLLEELSFCRVVVNPCRWRHFTDLSWKTLAHLTTLTMEGSRYINMSDVLCVLPKKCKVLRNIRLRCMPSVNNFILEAIATNLHDTLEELELEDAGNICPRGLEILLRTCNNLHSLHIGGRCVIDPVVFRNLSAADFQSKRIHTVYFRPLDPLPLYLLHLVIKMFPATTNFTASTNEPSDLLPFTLPASIATLSLEEFFLWPEGGNGTPNSFEVFLPRTTECVTTEAKSIFDLLPKLKKVGLGNRSIDLLRTCTPILITEWRGDVDDWITNFAYL